MKVTLETNDKDVDVDALLREADRLVQFALAQHSLLSELQHVRRAVKREKEVVVSKAPVSFTCSLSDFLRLAVCSCCTNITFLDVFLVVSGLLQQNTWPMGKLAS